MTQIRRPLARLLDDLEAARHHEHSQLHQRGVTTAALQSARMDTLRALLDYADAIETLSWPVPRKIQLDIKMRHALCRSTASNRAP